MLFSAASSTDAAIADSTQRDGSEISDRLASVNVSECASVKAVTTFSTSMKEARRLADGVPRAPGITAGSSSDSRNRIWS